MMFYYSVWVEEDNGYERVVGTFNQHEAAVLATRGLKRWRIVKWQALHPCTVETSDETEQAPEPRTVRSGRHWRERGVSLPDFVGDEELVADAHVNEKGEIIWARAWPGEEESGSR